MKAFGIKEYGNSSVLKSMHPRIADPGRNSVQIEVHAFAVNQYDGQLRQGLLQDTTRLRFPAILGSEVTGTVQMVGADVPMDIQIGDRVAAYLPARGGYAEYVNADADLVVPLPDNLDYETGAAVPTAGLAAYQAIVNHLKLQPGETLLIQGGTDSTGYYALQMAKQLMVTVYVITDRKHMAQAKAMGADEVLETHDLTALNQLPKVDAILDCLGDANFDRNYERIKIGGRLVSLIKDDLDDQRALNLHVDQGFLSIRADGEQLKMIVAAAGTGQLQTNKVETLPFRIQNVRDFQDRTHSDRLAHKLIIKVK